MNELKPCPFCGGKSYVDKIKDVYPNYVVRCNGCRARTRWHEKKENAVDTWNRRPEPENKPLTLAELRERDRMPIWIQGADDKTSGWTIYKRNATKQIACCPDDWNISYSMGEYGDAWTAYDHPPKEES